jgi:hypothetical protein
MTHAWRAAGSGWTPHRSCEVEDSEVEDSDEGCVSRRLRAMRRSLEVGVESLSPSGGNCDLAISSGRLLPHPL